MPKSKIEGWSSDYYKLPPDAKELQDLIEHQKMSFAEGNIFKAVYRLARKDGTSRMYDINKILWFAERLKRQEEEK
jgi:hypothetical protein